MYRIIAVIGILALCLVAFQFVQGRPVEAQAGTFVWEMEPRYESSWTSWNEIYQTYSQPYVYPNGWWLRFDACESSFGRPSEIQLYRWHIEGLDGITYGNGLPFDFEVIHTDCYYERDNTPAGSRSPLFPEQGDYRVTLTVEFYDGEQSTAEQTITVKDLLIISIGDSSASGEGNPIPPSANDGKRWWDQACHRSEISGHALAAKEIEDGDPHTSVTFLSFACSGAAIMKGLVLDYNGIDDMAEGYVLTPRPQLKSIIKQLCHTNEWTDPWDTYCIDNPRQIDALFIAIGVNDMKFEPLLKRCNEVAALADLGATDLILPGVWEFAVDSPNLNWNKIKTDYCAPDDATDWWAVYEDMNLPHALQFLKDLFIAGMNLEAPVFECTAKMDPIVDLNFATLNVHLDLLASILAGDVDQVISDITSCDDPYHEFAYRWMPLGMKRDLIRYYGNLDETMRNVLKPKEVYLTSYPANIFGNETGGAGCGFFFQIDPNEAQWFYETGSRLNQHLKYSAEKHHWYYVDGIVEAFEGHYYCSGDSYFIGLFESIYEQHDIYGTVHPNLAGHTEIAHRIVDTVNDPNKPDYADKHLVRVEYDSVRVTDERTNPDSVVLLKLEAHDRWFRNESLLAKDIEIPVGEEVSLAGYSFYSYLNQFDYVKVGASTELSDRYQVVPKCYPPDICTTVLEGPTLGFGGGNSYAYGSENGFSNENWCVRAQTLPGRFENTCTRMASRGGGTIEVTFRITVYDLRYYGEDYVGSDWVWCADDCFDESDVELAYPTLFAYQETSEAASPTVDEFMTLLTPDQLSSGKLLELSTENDRAYDMAIQPDGRILIVGDTETNSSLNQQSTLVRLNPNGTFDDSFAQGGKIIMGLTGDDHALSVAQTPSGKIVVAGYYQGDINYDFSIWRLNADGSLDPSFNTSGHRTVGNGGDDYGQKVLIQPDGKILVVGFTVNGSDRWVSLVRFNQNGTLDTTFDTDGKSSVNVGSGWVGVRDAMLQPDGKVVVVGGHSGNALVLRYHPNGTLDNSFSGDGIYELDMQANDVAQAVDLLPNGLLAVGAYSGGDFALFFLYENGTPCSDLCGLPEPPWLTVDFGDDDIVYDLTAQPDGKVLLVGATRGDPPSTSQIHLARYRRRLYRYELDPAFGQNGKTSLTLTGRDIAQAVALDPNYDIVVAGFGQIDGQDDFLLWRLPNKVTPPAIQPSLTQDGDQATLSWPASVFYSDGYIVWRSEDPNFTLAGLGAERVAEGNINSYDIPSEDVDQPYYYAIGGLDKANHHTWSEEIFNLGVEAPPAPSAPSVTLISPNGGETLNENTITVSWTANDLDGDTLTFHLQYSPDNGTTWQLVAQQIAGDHIDIDSYTLGSSPNGLFRVWVTDGVNTASDQSDAPFAIIGNLSLHLPVVLK